MPPRSLGVQPGELESELRACLRRRAAVVPPPTDLVAEAVIQRVRVVRRRQAAAGALAIVLITAVAGVALVRPWLAGAQPSAEDVALDRPTPQPAVTETAPTIEPTRTSDIAADSPLPSALNRELVTNRKLPVDVVVADHLLTAAGGTVNLASVGGVTEAYRVAGGWLVLSRETTGTASLWHVALGSAPETLLSEVEGIVVAPSGDRVAWREGTRVYVGTLRQGKINPFEETLAHAGAVPVTFVGKGLLLARKPTEELAGLYAIWWPGREESELRWRVATGVYGAMPDGRTVVAQVPGADQDQACLALLDALAELNPRALACDVPMTTGAAGWISPNGRWLMAERTASEAVVVDVPSAFNGEKPTVGTAPRPNGAGVWTDDQTVVFGSDGGLTRLRMDQAAEGKSDAAEQIEIKGGENRPILAVPSLTD